MPALRLDCDPFVSLFCDELWIAPRGILDEVDLKAASSEKTRGKNFVSGSLKLAHVSEASENRARRFECMGKLIEIIREHLQRAHLARNWSSHKSIGIVRILIFPQLLIAGIAPPQDDVPLSKRFSHFCIEPILAEEPKQVVQLEIVKAFSEWPRVNIFPNGAELLVAVHGLDLRSADKTIVAGQHSL